MSVSRATIAGRTYLDLQKQARANKRPVQEFLQLYLLEAFLDRLSQSHWRDELVLKGGVLLAAFGTGDPPVTSTFRPRRSIGQRYKPASSTSHRSRSTTASRSKQPPSSRS